MKNKMILIAMLVASVSVHAAEGGGSEKDRIQKAPVGSFCARITKLKADIDESNKMLNGGINYRYSSNDQSLRTCCISWARRLRCQKDLYAQVQDAKRASRSVYRGKRKDARTELRLIEEEVQRRLALPSVSEYDKDILVGLQRTLAGEEVVSEQHEEAMPGALTAESKEQGRHRYLTKEDSAAMRRAKQTVAAMRRGDSWRDLTANEIEDMPRPVDLSQGPLSLQVERNLLAQGIPVTFYDHETKTYSTTL